MIFPKDPFASLDLLRALLSFLGQHRAFDVWTAPHSMSMNDTPVAMAFNLHILPKFFLL